MSVKPSFSLLPEQEIPGSILKVQGKSICRNFARIVLTMSVGTSLLLGALVAVQAAESGFGISSKGTFKLHSAFSLLHPPITRS